MSDKNQRVKEYRLTDQGREQLADERNRWEQVSAAMARILRGAPEEGHA
jgi:DNA-binding PadR family transcriptional regulator